MVLHKSRVLALTFVTVGDPRHNIDKTLTMIETFPELLRDSVILALRLFDVFRLHANAELTSFFSNSSVNPCFAKGAGSTPRRVNLSARQAKHFSATSATLN